MDRLKRLEQFSTTIATAISVVAAQQASAWLQTHLQSSWFPTAAALLVFSVAFQISRFLLDLAVETSAMVRRLFLGRQDVEGTWLDLMLSEGKPMGFGFSRIEYAAGTLRFSGEDFTVDGARQGHYLTDMVVVQWPKVRYHYSYFPSDSRQVSHQGYGEALFIEQKNVPTRYVGFFFDLQEGIRISYESWRVTDPDLLLRLDDVENRRAAMLSFFGSRLAPSEIDSKAGERDEAGGV